MVPTEQFFCRGVILAGIQILEQTGSRQLSRADIETEIHQRIELPLLQRNLHQSRDRRLRGMQINSQHLRSLRLCNSIWKALGVDQLVSVTNRLQPRRVEVCPAAKTL